MEIIKYTKVDRIILLMSMYTLLNFQNIFSAIIFSNNLQVSFSGFYFT